MSIKSNKLNINKQNMIIKQAQEMQNTKKEQIIIDIFKLLSERNRLIILKALKDSDKNVNEILEYVDISQPTLSNHLLQLTENGIIKARRDGKKRYYTIIEPRIFNIINSVNEEIIESIISNIHKIQFKKTMKKLENSLL